MSLSASPTLPKPFAKATHISGYLWLVFLGCWLGGIFDGMDSSLMQVVLPVALKELTHGAPAAVISQVGSWVTGIFLIGWMVGGLVFGYLGDRVGRVKAMVFSILLYSVFTGLGGLATSWPMLAGFRFLTGLGIGGELVTIATFMAEVWPEKSRAVAIGVLLTSYQMGVFFAGAIHHYLPDWRHTFFVGAVPALLALVIRLFLKESDRWLHTRAEAEAQQTAVVQPMQLFTHPVFARDVWVGALGFGGLLVGYWASLSWIPTWLDQLPGSPDQARSSATMVQGLVAMVGCGLAGPLCDTVGRRWGLVLPALGAMAASVWLFWGHPVFNGTVYWAVAALGMAIGLMQAGLYIYLPELFPTLIRSTATGVCLNAGRLVTILAVFMMATVVGALGGYGKAALTFAMAYSLVVVAMAVARETRGLPLPE
jgi:MFS family permease